MLYCQKKPWNRREPSTLGKKSNSPNQLDIESTQLPHGGYELVVSMLKGYSGKVDGLFDHLTTEAPTKPSNISNT